MPTAWFPLKQFERLAWLRGFALNLADFVGQAGITVDDLTSVQDDLAAYEWCVLSSETLRTSHKSLNAYKVALATGDLNSLSGSYPGAPVFAPAPAMQVGNGIFRRIMMLIQRIKNTPGYHTSMGEALGIEAPKSTVEFGIPLFKAEALADGTVRLKYRKGRSSGVVIERQRGDETGWTEIARDRYSPFIDRDPPLEAGRPEVRRYRMRYLKRDEVVGERSAVVSVTTRV